MTGYNQGEYRHRENQMNGRHRRVQPPPRPSHASGSLRVDHRAGRRREFASQPLPLREGVGGRGWRARIFSATLAPISHTLAAAALGLFRTTNCLTKWRPVVPWVYGRSDPLGRSRLTGGVGVWSQMRRPQPEQSPRTRRTRMDHQRSDDRTLGSRLQSVRNQDCVRKGHS